MKLLAPLELVYRGVNRVRRDLYRRGILKSQSLPRPVISIGNISVGGSGKTPTTIAVAEQFVQAGYDVAILTRGYGRSGSEEWAIVDVPDARRFGDEPVMLAGRLPGCTIVVGSDRYLSGMAFLERSDCQIFILDDGFQHLQLHRDLDIVIDDPDARFYREGRSALASADIQLVRARSIDEKPTASDPRFRAILLASGYRRKGNPGHLRSLRGVRCMAVAALAKNESFFETLASEGITLVRTLGFPDHHEYSATDLASIEKTKIESGAELVLVTEKDAVKLPVEFDCAIIEVEMKIVPEDSFHSLLSEEARRLMEPAAR